jgi:steroid delta-isomerase-like uncharacterized protein
LERENEAIVRRFYDEVVNQRNLTLAATVLSPDYVEHLNPNGSGLDGFERFAKGLVGAFPDLLVQVEETIAAGDRVVARVTVSGTHAGEFMGHPPTGRKFTMAGVDIFALEGGRIAGRWNYRDLLGMLGQLGLV